MRFVIVIAAFMLASAASAQDFVPAEILDFQSRTSITEDFNVFGGSNTEADNYKEIRVRMGDQIVVGRTWSAGGGMVWVHRNPLAFVVGKTVEARIVQKAGQHLEIRVQERKQPLKFMIQRVELVKN